MSFISKISAWLDGLSGHNASTQNALAALWTREKDVLQAQLADASDLIAKQRKAIQSFIAKDVAAAKAPAPPLPGNSALTSESNPVQPPFPGFLTL